MKTHPVFRALDKPLTILGVERKFFFSILILSFGLFQASKVLLPALMVFFILWLIAKAAMQSDPRLFEILIRGSRFASRYDPALQPKGDEGRGFSSATV